MTLTFEQRIRQWADQGAPEETEVVEHVDAFSGIKLDIHKAVIATVGPKLLRQRESKPEDVLDAVGSAVDEAIEGTGQYVSSADREQILRDMADDILGCGPIEQFLRDESISEIMVNSFDTVYVERKGKIVRTDVRFMDEGHLLRTIDKIVSRIGRRIDESSPMVDARLQDGSRVHAIIPPLALKGSCLTIRKFRADPLQMDDLVAYGTLSPMAAKLLEMCVQGACNVLISGGTGSGKTTTLNVLSGAIPAEERIITIEDAAELQLKQEHVISLETRPDNSEGKGAVTIRDLVKTCLRMRPDRIVVGECRGPEALDMLQAMNTGHDGSMTTIHSNNPREAMARLETLVLTSGVELPLRAIREQIAGAVDIVVQISRLVDGSRRITHITEVVGMEDGIITLQDLFVAKPLEAGEVAPGTKNKLYGPLQMTGVKPTFLDKLAGHGVKVPDSLFATQEDRLGGRPSFPKGASRR